MTGDVDPVGPPVGVRVVRTLSMVPHGISLHSRKCAIYVIAKRGPEEGREETNERRKTW